MGEILSRMFHENKYNFMQWLAKAWMMHLKFLCPKTPLFWILKMHKPLPNYFEHN